MNMISIGFLATKTIPDPDLHLTLLCRARVVMLTSLHLPRVMLKVLRPNVC